MTIYENLLLSVQKEMKQFRIDLKKKSLRIGGKQIIENGVIVDKDKKYEDYIPINSLMPYEILEQLYATYKRSVPQDFILGNKPYFKAVDADELTDRELVVNQQRNYAQASLEGYILCACLQGCLQWEDKSKWFWQSKKDKDLVVLKEWL